MIMDANKMSLKSDATHVFLFQGYAGEQEWLRDAKGIIRLFPEQPNQPEFVVGNDA